jgi:hypothetical protein
VTRSLSPDAEIAALTAAIADRTREADAARHEREAARADAKIARGVASALMRKHAELTAYIAQLEAALRARPPVVIDLRDGVRS